MTTREEVRREFEELGYLRLKGPPEEFGGEISAEYIDSVVESPNRPPLFPKGCIWLRWKSSTDAVTHVVLLEDKPRKRAYGVSVGAHNIPATLLARIFAPLASKYVGLGSQTCINFALIRSWMLFDAGRAMRWPTLSIPNVFQPHEWRQQLTDLGTEFLSPFFWGLKQPSDILELLFKEEPPFEWYSANTPLRVLEILCISKVAGIQVNVAKKRLYDFLPVISSGMHGTKYAQRNIGISERMIEELATNIYSTA